jgi:protease-4
MSEKRFGCFGIFLAVVLCGSLLLNLVFIATRSATAALSGASLGGHLGDGPKFDESVLLPAKSRSDDKIALLSLRGVITGAESGVVGQTMVDDLRLQCKQAAEDPKVKAVVVEIDSPGGEVTASDILYNAVKNIRDVAHKPVVISMGSVAASGGYYVACAGSWVIANETTFTGSIGVIMQTLNYQQLFGKVGLESVTFKSGKFKDMLSGSRAMSEEEREYVQKMVMDTYGKFVGIVARERQLPEADLRAGVADGRVVSGKDALEAKLVNQLGLIEDAYAKARELAEAPDAAVIRYESGFNLGKLFHLLGQSEKAQVSVQWPPQLGARLEPGRFYYLPSFYAQ